MKNNRDNFGPADIDIVPVSGKSAMRKFIRLPWHIYQDDAYWVAPLLSDVKKTLSAKNPFFKKNPAQFFLARSGSTNKVVGRIAAIINHQHNEYHQEQCGFFGFLEAEDHPAIFQALFAATEDWLKSRGCTKIVGPVNPNTNDSAGLLIDGFDSAPFFMMAHNPSYYQRHIEALDLVKAMDLFSYYFDHKKKPADSKSLIISQKLQQKYPIVVRHANMSRFQDELKLVRDIYNDAWSSNWGFVPMTIDEFEYIADDFRKILDPELLLIVEFNGEPAGFSLNIPNYNEVFKKIPSGRLLPRGLFTFLKYRKLIETVRIITLGIKKEYQRYGLGGVLYHENIVRSHRKGYFRGEMSWVLENNDMMNRAARHLGGERYKTYRLYQKHF